MRKEGRTLEEWFAPDWVACLWLPQFAVRAELERQPDLVGYPVALVVRKDGERSASVCVCSREAIAAGLFPGMPAHAVPNHCPSAVLLPFDGRYYTARYEEVLRLLDRLSPEIEVLPLEVFYVDLSGMPPSTTDPAVVLQAVREILPRAFSVRVGLATGKFTARVAAHSASEVRPIAIPDDEREMFLKEAPSSLLPGALETARRRDLLGLRTLGRIARLPRSSMLAQFGREGERAHRLACGDDREPLRPYQPPAVIRESYEFEDAAPTFTLFELALESILRRACLRPERQGRGIRQVHLEAVMESGEIWERTITLRRPSERLELIFDELKRRLEPVRPVGAITELSVELTAFASRVEAQWLLFPDERRHRRERLAYELEQLRERGGSPGVCQIVEVEPWSRLPEKLHALLPYDI